MGIWRLVGLGWWRGLFRACQHGEFHGIRVASLLFDREERAMGLAKLAKAMDLIAAHDPRSLQRMRDDVDGIFIFGSHGPLGQWLRDPKFVLVAEDHVVDPTATPARLASTLVHEGTHAWLERQGFNYAPECRPRIEAVCVRSEIAFARRLPDPEDLGARGERELARRADFWSDERGLQRGADQLTKLGVPRWLVRWIVRRARINWSRRRPS